MIVGVIGRAQHGKDSTGNYLVENYGFKRYAFADQLKSMARALDPIIDWTESGTAIRLGKYLDDTDGNWEGAKQFSEVRRFLQVLGTEGVRDHLGENSWVAALQKKLFDDDQLTWADDADPYEAAAPVEVYGTNVVITDVRFPNEAQWVKVLLQGQLWRVKRVELYEAAGTGLKPFDNGVNPDHPSEAHVDELPADREIEAWNLEVLYQEIDKIMAGE